MTRLFKWRIALVLLCSLLVGGCTLKQVWEGVLIVWAVGEAIINSSDPNENENGTEPPVVNTADPCPCSGLPGGFARVTVTGGANLTPNPQYCFLKIEGSQPWQSSPQAFGPGTHVLQFDGVPQHNTDYELVTCITSDLAAANAGNVDVASQIKKTFVATVNCSTKKCALIEYDCMTGRDIRGGTNLFDFITSRFVPADVACSLHTDQQNLTDMSYSSLQQLSDSTLNNWRQKFIQGTTTADFCIMGVKTCINRANFFGSLIPLSDSVVGLSFPVSGDSTDSLGDRGSFSMVFKHDLDSLLNTSSRQKGYNQIAVHELGHAMANLTHPYSVPSQHNGGTNSGCVMNAHEFTANGSLRSGRDQFCNKCRNNIANWQWEY